MTTDNTDIEVWLADNSLYIMVAVTIALTSLSLVGYLTYNPPLTAQMALAAGAVGAATMISAAVGYYRNRVEA